MPIEAKPAINAIIEHSFTTTVIDDRSTTTASSAEKELAMTNGESANVNEIYESLFLTTV